jgi:hypothetical protein
MSSELGRVWKEAEVVLFQVLLRHLPEGTEENKETCYLESVSRI